MRNLPPLDQIRLNCAGHKNVWLWVSVFYRDRWLAEKLSKKVDERCEGWARARTLMRIFLHLVPWIWLFAVVSTFGGLLFKATSFLTLLLISGGFALLLVTVSLALGLAFCLVFGIGSALFDSLVFGLFSSLFSGAIFVLFHASGFVFVLLGGCLFGMLFGFGRGRDIRVSGVLVLVASVVVVSIAGMILGSHFGFDVSRNFGLAGGLGTVVGFYFAAFRLYYWIWPQVLRRLQHVTIGPWKGHPVVWDRDCRTPLMHLDSILISFWESSPAFGWRLVRRLIRKNVSQRPRALKALVALIGRTTARAEQLDQLPRLLAELPVGDKGWLQSSEVVKSAAAEIAGKWRNANAAQTHYARRLGLDEVLEEMERFRGRVAGLPEPLASEFLRAADAWTATTQRVMAAIPAEVPHFFENAETVIRPDSLAFVRRDALLSEMERLLTQPGGGSGLLLYARKRMGKSTLLENLKPLVSKELSVAYISMQSAEAFTSTDHWAAHVGRTAAAACPEAEGMAPIADLAGLATFLRELDGRLEKAGRRVLIALDEYEVIDEKIGAGQLSADILMQIRAAIQHQRHIRWLISGVHHFLEMKHGDWAATFSACQQVTVRPFTEAETQELLTEPLKHARAFGARPLPEQAFFKNFWKPGMIEAIHRESQGWPALVQGLAREICRECTTRNVLEPEHAILEPAFQRACSSLDSTLATLLLKQETKEPARSASRWLQGFRTTHEQAPPEDEAVRDLLKRHELIADLNAPLWRLRVPLMQRYLEMEG